MFLEQPILAGSDIKKKMASNGNEDKFVISFPFKLNFSLVGCLRGGMRTGVLPGSCSYLTCTLSRPLSIESGQFQVDFLWSFFFGFLDVLYSTLTNGCNLEAVFQSRFCSDWHLLFFWIRIRIHFPVGSWSAFILI